MKNQIILDYDVEAEFPRFLKKLREGGQLEWQWLLDMFRERVVPWLYIKDGNLPPGTIASTDEFIEEVFANTLFRFYELFEKGVFNGLADLRGLTFRIAEFKLKEGYNSVRRDRLIYFTEDVLAEGVSDKQDDLTLREEEDKEMVAELRVQINSLKNEDKEILLRYAGGEELGSIASNLGMEASTCRKRKQRALDKLKALVVNALKK